MIRSMREGDRGEVIAMMRTFYDSPAVYYDADIATLERDIDACVGDSPYLDGYIFDSDGTVAGYAMCAKSYTTEFGGICVWIEDLYLKPEARGLGLADEFFGFLRDAYPQAVRFRLEAERENSRAIRVYARNGFADVPYVEMDLQIPPHG